MAGNEPRLTRSKAKDQAQEISRVTRSASTAAKVNGSSAISDNADGKGKAASKKRKGGNDDEALSAAKPGKKQRKEREPTGLEPIAEEDEGVDEEEPATEVFNGVPPEEANGGPAESSRELVAD